MNHIHHLNIYKKYIYILKLVNANREKTPSKQNMDASKIFFEVYDAYLNLNNISFF